MSSLVYNVYVLIARNWAEENAIRAVAAKHDVPDYELALYLLELESNDL